MPRYTAKSIIPGIKITSDNPDVWPVIYKGKECIAKRDSETGMVDLYSVKINVKKMKTLSETLLREIVGQLPNNPTIDEKELISVTDSRLFINPIIYTLKDDTDIFRYLIKIFDYAVIYLKRYNEPVVVITFPKYSLGTVTKVISLALELNTKEYSDFNIKIES